MRCMRFNCIAKGVCLQSCNPIAVMGIWGPFVGLDLGNPPAAIRLALAGAVGLGLPAALCGRAGSLFDLVLKKNGDERGAGDGQTMS